MGFTKHKVIQSGLQEQRHICVMRTMNTNCFLQRPMNSWAYHTREWKNLQVTISSRHWILVSGLTTSALRLASLQVLTHTKKLKLAPQILLVLRALHLTSVRPSTLPTCPHFLHSLTQVCFHSMNSAVMKPKLLQTSLTVHLQQQWRNTNPIYMVFQLKQQQLLPTNANRLQVRH